MLHKSGVIMKLVEFLVNIIQILIHDEKLIVIILKHDYRSSSIQLLKAMNRELDDFKLKVVIDPLNLVKSGNWNLESTLRKFRKYYWIIKAKIVITTHGQLKLGNKTIVLNLWHGVPLKAMGYMQKNTVYKGTNQLSQFVSTSVINNVLLNSCLGINESNYSITGLPRNDLLFYYSNKKKFRSEILVRSTGASKCKLILYTPTIILKAHENDDCSVGLFTDQDLRLINQYCKRKNFIFCIRLHPSDKEFYLDIDDKLRKFENIVDLYSSKLDDYDLYEYLNVFDVMITDYSSIFIDFLLVDNPIIFFIPNLELYRQKVGLLLEPYESYLPGYIAYNSNMLISSLDEILDADKYVLPRKKARDVFHLYQDEFSSKRVSLLVRDLMTKSNS